MSATKNQDLRKAMPVTETQLYYITQMIQISTSKIGF